MELNISAQAAARLAPLLRADRVLILDLNEWHRPLFAVVSRSNAS